MGINFSELRPQVHLIRLQDLFVENFNVFNNQDFVAFSFWSLPSLKKSDFLGRRKSFLKARFGDAPFSFIDQIIDLVLYKNFGPQILLSTARKHGTQTEFEAFFLQIFTNCGAAA